MRLNLYECEYSYKYKHDNKSVNRNRFKPLFSWRPTQPQWWITGFKGNKVHLDVERLAMVGSIDFSGRHDLYDALKEYTLRDDKHRKFMIFHEDKTDRAE